MEIVVRVLGIAALFCGVISFQFQKHKGIMLCKMVSEFLFAVQYFLLGAYSGGLMDLISGARNLLFFKLVQKKKSTLPVILGFSALILVLGYLSWEGAVSLLPVAAKLITTVSYGMKNERLLRLITLPSCLCWIAYNAVIGTWDAMFTDLLSLGSILIALCKFDLKKAEKPPRQAD